MFFSYQSQHDVNIKVVPHSNNPVSVLRVHPHLHKDFEIFLLLTGQALFYVENSIYRLKPGQVVIINSEEEHSFLLNGAETEGIEIRFNPSDLYFHAMRIMDTQHCFVDRPKGMRNLIDIPQKQYDNIIGLVNKIRFYGSNESYGYGALKLTSFVELLVHLNVIFMNSEDTKVSKILHDDLQVILNYINNNLSSDLSLESLANRFFMDKFYLCRMFKKYTGYSLHKYIVLKRIFLSKSLLHKGISVTNACHMSGFNDYSNFVKTFKKVSGLSPLQYVKKYAGKSDEEEYNRTYDLFIESYSAAFGMPDLIVTDISWSPENPVECDNVTFSAVIINIGTGSTPAGVITGVGFCVNGYTETWSDNYALPITPGESVLLTANGGNGGIPAWHAPAGVHEITAFVDDIRRINENSRENNKLSKTLIIRSKQ